MIFIEGQGAKVPLEALIAKGRELIAAGYPQRTPSFNQDMNEAATAVHWYDEQHRQWIVSQQASDTTSGAPRVPDVRPEFEGPRKAGPSAVKAGQAVRAQLSLLDTPPNS